MIARHLRAGSRAEHIAQRWLERKGLALIVSNYRCKLGELDLVMLDQGCLVVVEVRYRRSGGYGGPLLSVSHRKQQRIARTTQHFLQRQTAYRQHALRFDVLTLTGALANPVIEWRRRAFTVDAQL